MADINPAELDGEQQWTPHRAALPRVVAEVKRVTEQQMRSNPLVNAIVPRGLTRWRGNYGGDFVWIGEFLPADPTLGTPQRGVSIVRDDPQAQSAFALYDWNPVAGQPLRQKLRLGDGDGRNLLMEGGHGGQYWPRFPVDLYTTGAHNETSSTTVAYARSQLVGRHLEFLLFIRIYAWWPVQGAPGFANVNMPLESAAAASTTRVSVQVSVTAGSHTMNSATQVVGSGSAFISDTIDLSPAFDDNVDFMIINVNAWQSAGSTSQNGFTVVPVYCHNYSAS